MSEFKRLPESEEQIMITIWNSEGALSLNEVMEASNRKFGKERKPQTVSTFLERLKKKDFIQAYRAGRQMRYFPKDITGEEYRKLVMQGLLQGLYEGNKEQLSADIME